MKRIRIGVMGCASIAQRSVIPAILSLPECFELVCVASRTFEKANSFANLFNCKAVVGYDQLLNEDIDAVYVPLPTGLHDEWINKALLAGKHVYAEKSVANDHFSALKMIENARNNGLALMEGYMFQYHPQHSIVKKLILSNEIGGIRSFRSSFGFPPLPADDFRYDNEIGGGALLDAAGYTVRAVHFILGDLFEVKAATLYSDNETGTNLYGSAFLTSEDGVGAHVSFGFDNFYQCNYEIWGSKGKITVNKAFTPGPEYKPTILLEKQGNSKTIVVEAFNHFTAAFKEFYRIVFNEKARQQHFTNIALQSSSLSTIKRIANY